MPEASEICVSFAEDLALLEPAVRAAGEIARQAYEANDSKVWDKTENHPVTDADITVNNYLAKVLRAERPGYGWLSEETKDDHSRHACPRTFVVDPIDGTRAFIDRSPNFAVSVAIIQDGISIAAALYNPLTNEMFTAFKGGGAKVNGAPIQVTNCTEIKGCNMVGYPRKFRRLGWPEMNVTIANSMAYRIALVACGKADATIAFTPKSDWDLAAAELIAIEAGAQITNLRGEAFRYDAQSTTELGVICAGPSLMPLISKRLKTLIDAAEKSDAPSRDFAHLGTRRSDRMTDTKVTPDQLLHIVFGGELVDPMKTEFIDLSKVDFIGAYPNFAKAREAWKSAAHSR